MNNNADMIQRRKERKLAEIPNRDEWLYPSLFFIILFFFFFFFFSFILFYCKC